MDSIDYVAIMKNIIHFTLCNKFCVAFHHAVFVLCSIMQLTQMWYFFKQYSLELLINYAHHLALTLCAVYTLFETLRLKSFIINIVDEYESFQISWRKDRKIWKKLNQKAKVITSFTILIFGSGILLMVLLNPFLSFSKQHILLYFLIDKYCLNYSRLFWLISLFYWVTIPYMIFMTTFIVFPLIYAMLNISGCIRFTSEDFLRTTERFNSLSDISLRQSQLYQNMVYKNIILLIERQLTIKRSIKRIIDSVKPTTNGYTILGFLGILFGIYNTLNYLNQPNFLYIVLVVLSAFMSFLVACLCWQSGQLIEEESVRLCRVGPKAKWYNWNKKNCQALIIFMSPVKPQVLTVLKCFEIDYIFGIRLLRFACSTAISFYQLGFADRFIQSYS